MKDQLIRTSKFLSLVLRHRPETIGIILSIASEQMNKDGHLFFRSANGVWLTESVPVEYIEFPAPQLDSH